MEDHDDIFPETPLNIPPILIIEVFSLKIFNDVVMFLSNFHPQQAANISYYFLIISIWDNTVVYQRVTGWAKFYTVTNYQPVFITIIVMFRQLYYKN